MTEQRRKCKDMKEVKEGKSCREDVSEGWCRGEVQPLKKVGIGGSLLSCPVSDAAPTSRLA